MTDYQGKRFKSKDGANGAPQIPRGNGAGAAKPGHFGTGSTQPGHFGTGAKSKASAGQTQAGHFAGKTQVTQPTVQAKPIKGIVPVNTKDKRTTSSHLAKPKLATDSAAEYDSPKQKRKRRQILPILFIVIGIGLLAAAAGIFIMAQIGYNEATETYDNIAQTYLSDSEGDDIPNPDFDQLASVNADVVGWIYIPGTTINYPVVQGTNNEKYLNTLFDGKSNVSGSIFMDYEGTAPGVVDQQTTLFGHHMNNGGMFNPIADTTDQSTFDNIKTVYYITRDKVYQFTPLLTKVVDGSYNNARVGNFSGDTALSSYLLEMLDGADAKASDAEERVSQTEQVLTLVTCKRDFLANGRAAMICTLTNTSDRNAGSSESSDDGSGDESATESTDATAETTDQTTEAAA